MDFIVHSPRSSIEFNSFTEYAELSNVKFVFRPADFEFIYISRVWIALESVAHVAIITLERWNWVISAVLLLTLVLFTKIHAIFVVLLCIFHATTRKTHTSCGTRTLTNWWLQSKIVVCFYTRLWFINESGWAECTQLRLISAKYSFVSTRLKWSNF